jgi:hypothetical protein
MGISDGIRMNKEIRISHLHDSAKKPGCMFKMAEICLCGSPAAYSALTIEYIFTLPSPLPQGRGSFECLIGKLKDDKIPDSLDEYRIMQVGVGQRGSMGAE